MTEISCPLKVDLIVILQINAYAFSINFFFVYIKMSICVDSLGNASFWSIKVIQRITYNVLT